jgi:broad specificity phosphatase PhoE
MAELQVLLVRHAQAASRSDWDGEDEDRPLTREGRRQAEALAEKLSAFGPRRLLSSPARRCLETLAPLTKETALEVEEASELAEGADPKAALRLLRSSPSPSVAVSHGDLIPGILRLVAEEDGVMVAEPFLCQKASVWVLEGRRERFEQAYYLGAP